MVREFSRQTLGHLRENLIGMGPGTNKMDILKRQIKNFTIRFKEHNQS